MRVRFTQLAALVLTSFLTAGAHAFDSYNLFPAGSGTQICYGQAMVGMDSVINSRIGVPPEHALELARVQPASLSHELYSTSILETILNAYLWEGTPHSYAITVFYKCAQQRSHLRNAVTALDDNTTVIE